MFQDLDAGAQATFIQHLWRFLEHHDTGAVPLHRAQGRLTTALSS